MKKNLVDTYPGVRRRGAIRRIVRVIECLLAWVAICAFMAGLVFSTFGPTRPFFASHVEFPLSEPVDVAVDDQGNIYVALSFYSRIHVYNAQGEFQRGFFVEAGGGDLRLTIDDQGFLRVVTARGSLVHVIDKNGKFLRIEPQREQDVSREFMQLYSKRATGVLDAAGRRYQIHNPHLSPRIVRSEPNGTVSLQIRTRWLLIPLLGPIPCWLSLLVASLSEWILRRVGRGGPV